MVQQDPWEHATLPQSTRAHSVWATAQASDPACGHRLKGKHTVKQVAFAMFIKRVVVLLVQIVLVMQDSCSILHIISSIYVNAFTTL